MTTNYKAFHKGNGETYLAYGKAISKSSCCEDEVLILYTDGINIYARSEKEFDEKFLKVRKKNDKKTTNIATTAS